MNGSSYVKKRGWRPISLRDRLLLGLVLAALGTVAVAVVGWLSFERVAASQREIVRETLPGADALHELVRGNARLAALAPRLGRADSSAELGRLRAVLDEELQRMRERMEAFANPHVEPELVSRLGRTRAALAEHAERLAETVMLRLDLRAERQGRMQLLRNTAAEFGEIANVQYDNSIAALVASLTRLHDADAVAFDRLFDNDLDGVERMHELQLAIRTLAMLVDRVDELDTAPQLQAGRDAYQAGLGMLLRRVRDIGDPSVRVRAAGLAADLSAALDPAGAFALRDTEIALRSRTDELQLQIGELTTQLDALAGELIHRGGRMLAAAGASAEAAVGQGLIAYGVIAGSLLVVTLLVLVVVLRRHLFGRLAALEGAARALAAGQRDVAIDTSGGDELAALAKALAGFRDDAIERDQFAAALRDQREHLEAEVAARTAELRDSNAALARETAEHAAARAAAEQANRAKTAFLGTVSHELRTPMAGVLGVLELLARTELQASQREYVAQTRTAATILLELLEDMLDFARIEAGGLRIEPEAFSVRDTVQDIFAVQGVRAQARGLALVADIAAGVPDRLSGDRRKLGQVLLNLVGNAIKFSDEGAVSVKVVCLERTAAACRLCFEVIDHGIGITAEAQSAVFEPFVQVRDSGRHHGGTGLGLAVCRRLIEAMGGSIGLRSTPGEGTTVSFELAFALAAEAPGEAAAVVGCPRLDVAHAVLVVEDDAVNRMVIERFLESLGQRPVSVCCGAQALEAFAAHGAELALIDINLPDIDGCEVLARLRASAPGTAPRAVAMSAHLTQGETQRLCEAGFEAFLSKPFSRDQLACTLVALLESGAGSDAPAVPPPAGGQAWVDGEFLRNELAMLGEPALRDIVRVFERQGERLMGELAVAAAAADTAGCAALAHKLRGAAGNLGLDRLREGAGAFERRSGEGAALQMGAEALAQLYRESLLRLHAALEALTGGSPQDRRSTASR